VTVNGQLERLATVDRPAYETTEPRWVCPHVLRSPGGAREVPVPEQRFADVPAFPVCCVIVAA
jgi:hypothetical protein